MQKNRGLLSPLHQRGSFHGHRHCCVTIAGGPRRCVRGRVLFTVPYWYGIPVPVALQCEISRRRVYRASVPSTSRGADTVCRVTSEKIKHSPAFNFVTPATDSIPYRTVDYDTWYDTIKLPAAAVTVTVWPFND